MVTRRGFLGGLGAAICAPSVRAQTALDVRNFNIRGDGITDDSDGWRALALQAKSQPGSPIRGRRGDVYRLDQSKAVQFPNSSRFELDGARFLRTAPLQPGQYLLHFGTDTVVDSLAVQMGPEASFRRLIRFYDRATVHSVDLKADVRVGSKISDLDACLLFVGNENRSTLADERHGHFRLDRIDSRNIDAVVLFTQFSVEPGVPNPLRDVKVGTCRFTKSVMGLYLRNVSGAVVDDVRQAEFADGAQPAEPGGNAVLCNGGHDLLFKRIEAIDTPSHGMRIGGPVKNTFELEPSNITVESFISRRSRRSGFKCKPGREGARAKNIALHKAEVYDAHFANAPSTNEQGVLLECTDGFSAGVVTVGVRDATDGTSSHDAVHLSNVTDVNFDKLVSDHPYRHHVWINTTPQAYFPHGPVRDVRFGAIDGRSARAASIGIDGFDQEVGNIEVQKALLRGSPVLDLRSGKVTGRISIEGDVGRGRSTCSPTVDASRVRINGRPC